MGAHGNRKKPNHYQQGGESDCYTINDSTDLAAVVNIILLGEKASQRTGPVLASKKRTLSHIKREKARHEVAELRKSAARKLAVLQ